MMHKSSKRVRFAHYPGLRFLFRLGHLRLNLVHFRLPLLLILKQTGTQFFFLGEIVLEFRALCRHSIQLLPQGITFLRYLMAIVIQF